MFPGRDIILLDGPMRLEISGSSVGLVWTRTGQTVTSMTCGSTVLVNGRGWAAQTWSTKQGRTELKGRLPPAMFLGRERRPLDGVMRPEISGSLVEQVWTR
jgi:hypothetical protein